MRIAIGSEHAGFRLKEHFIAVLREGGHEVDDLGTDSEAAVDYPIYCSTGRSRGSPPGTPGQAGIVLGGSGQGEQLLADEVKGVRAALCNDLYTAEYSRPAQRCQCVVGRRARRR